MCAKLNKAQMESLRYREVRLKQLQEQLERCFSGSEASLLPLVRTKAGAHSEAKTWKLVDALMDALSRSEKSALGGSAMSEAEAKLFLGDGALCEGEAEFFRAFLYCAIRVSADCGAWWGTRGRFSDIVRFSEDIWPRNELVLHHLELDDPYFYTDYFFRGSGFFALMDGLYLLFSGHSVSEMLTDGEIAAVRAKWPEIDDEYYKDMPEDMPDADEDPELSALPEEYWDELAKKMKSSLRGRRRKPNEWSPPSQRRMSSAVSISSSAGDTSRGWETAMRPRPRPRSRSGCAVCWISIWPSRVTPSIWTTTASSALTRS